MKNSIKLFAIFFLLSTGLFASVPVKTVPHKAPARRDMVMFSSLPSRTGIAVKMRKGVMGKAVVIIYDQDMNVLRKDVLSNQKGKGMQKGYVLTQLDNGDYSIEVTANKQVIKKGIHVYNEGDIKTFIIKE